MTLCGTMTQLQVNPLTPNVECPDVKNYKWRLNPVWHRKIYSCIHMATVGVKGLMMKTWSLSRTNCHGLIFSVIQTENIGLTQSLYWTLYSLMFGVNRNIVHPSGRYQDSIAGMTIHSWAYSLLENFDRAHRSITIAVSSSTVNMCLCCTASGMSKSRVFYTPHISDAPHTVEVTFRNFGARIISGRIMVLQEGVRIFMLYLAVLTMPRCVSDHGVPYDGQTDRHYMRQHSSLRA